MSAFAQLIKLIDEGLRVVQGHPRIAHHKLAELGQDHAAGLPFEQGKAEQQFDVAQHLADGGLGQVHQLGSRMHVARPGQRIDQHQVLDLEPFADAGV
ncbi:hypothetical protein D3C87_1658650 [compost metagenome]